jgi:hypothetical protein
MVEDVLTPTYNLANAPWFVMKPTPDELEMFDKQLSKTVLDDFFALLRNNPELPHTAVVLPQLGGITAGEMALVYLRANITTRRKRKQLVTEQIKTNTTLTQKPQKARKQRPLWSNLR